MATWTSLEPNDNIHSIMTSRAGIKKLEKEPAGYAVKAEKDASNTSVNRLPGREILPLFNEGKLELLLVLSFYCTELKKKKPLSAFSCQLITNFSYPRFTNSY